jgi:DNA polymerase V
MKQRRLLWERGGSIVIPTLRNTENKFSFIPLFISSVQAGFPSPADDYIETYLDLNTRLIKNPASTFFIVAQGNSMTGTEISSGDLLIVDRGLDARHGNIVIAAIDGELTIKRLSKLNGRVQLLFGNKNHQPLDITNEQDLVIWGVVKHIIKEV